MENINKYFSILENMKLFTKCKNDDIQRIGDNMETLQRYLKICPEELNDLTTVENYSVYLMHLLKSIKEHANFDSNDKEYLISIQHLNLFMDAVIEMSRYRTRCFFPSNIRNHPLFRLNMKITLQPSSTTTEKIKPMLQFLFEILQIKTIASRSTMDPVILELMAIIYSLQSDGYLNEILTYIWNYTSKEKYFKNLLILKSISELSASTKQKLHKDLLDKLTQPGGFKILVQNLIIPGHEDIPEWKRYKTISNIVACKGHSEEFYDNMIKQIFDFIRSSIIDTNMSPFIPAGVISLRNLYLLTDNLKEKILDKFNIYLKPFYEPEVILTGAIVMEDHEFKLLICLFFNCFYRSSLERLPSEILIKYLPLFINLYNQLPEKSNESDQIKLIIIQCLANREKIVLKSIISYILQCSRDDRKDFQELHPRITVNFNDKLNTYNLQIIPEELPYTVEPHSILPRILKTSNNNILIYNVFICVLGILDEEVDLNSSNNETHNIDLIHDQDEFDQFILHNYKRQLIAVSLLTDLIAYKPFHSQFQENPNEIIAVIGNFLQKRITKPSYNDESDHILSMVLAIFQECLENSKDMERFKEFCSTLKCFLKRVKNVATIHQVTILINLIENGTTVNSDRCNQSQYNFARSLIEESQPHLRVYGIQQLLKLLKEKDEETFSNRNAILAIALHALRDDESYTYLNCVRLLVCLVGVLESEVLDTLSSEYLNEDESLVFRLKVGEAILKVTEDLGPLSYKYKDVLLNCFLYGCKSKINEFRASSFSNLATLCRILSYQVHNFFQELLSMIDAILQTECYLPAKRSAVMVLSQLLWGMDNIVDYQDYLLPIYRLLTLIVEHDRDNVTRVHATNGLKALSEKCKSFLFPEQILKKEIKIVGIKDDDSSKKVTITELS